MSKTIDTDRCWLRSKLRTVDRLLQAGDISHDAAESMTASVFKEFLGRRMWAAQGRWPGARPPRLSAVRVTHTE